MTAPVGGLVWVRHPVTGGEAEVPATALAQLRQSGWDLIPDEELAARAAAAAEPDTEQPGTEQPDVEPPAQIPQPAPAEPVPADEPDTTPTDPTPAPAPAAKKQRTS